MTYRHKFGIQGQKTNLEPIFERQPSKCVNDQLPLPEVCGLVDAGKVAREVTERTDHLGGGHPALVLPVRGLQTPRTPSSRLNILPTLPVLVTSVVTSPTVPETSQKVLKVAKGRAKVKH